MLIAVTSARAQNGTASTQDPDTIRWDDGAIRFGDAVRLEPHARFQTDLWLRDRPNEPGDSVDWPRRRISIDGELFKVVERWPGPVQGTPSVGADAFVFPMADGDLRRQPLGDGPGAHGPPWRSRFADADAPGHVLQLAPNDYLFTDGSTGLIRETWADSSWKEQARVTQFLSEKVS